MLHVPSLLLRWTDHSTSLRKALQDTRRDTILKGLGLRVLRFHSAEVLRNTDAVTEAILEAVVDGRRQIPPPPLFQRGGHHGT